LEFHSDTLQFPVSPPRLLLEVLLSGDICCFLFGSAASPSMTRSTFRRLYNLIRRPYFILQFGGFGMSFERNN